MSKALKWLAVQLACTISPANGVWAGDLERVYCDLARLEIVPGHAPCIALICMQQLVQGAQ